MVTSVTAVLKRIKVEWATQLQPEGIIAACQEAGYTSWRDRVLGQIKQTYQNRYRVSGKQLNL